MLIVQLKLRIGHTLITIRLNLLVVLVTLGVVFAMSALSGWPLWLCSTIVFVGDNLLRYLAKRHLARR